MKAIRINGRTITLSLLILLILGILVALIEQTRRQLDPMRGTLEFSALTGCIVLFWATWKNWPYAKFIICILFSIFIGFLPNGLYLTDRSSLVIFLPPIITMVLLSSSWIISSAVGTLFIILMRAGWHGIYLEFLNIIIYSVSVGGMVLGRIVSDTAIRDAKQERNLAEQASTALHLANTTLEQRVVERTAEVQNKLVELEKYADEQTRLLAEIDQQQRTIRNLSIPVIPINANTLIMPLVGEIDTRRIQDIHTQTLQALQTRGMRTLILDITGVPLLDASVAQAFVQVAQAAQLLGCRVIVVGIRPEVAQTIVSLGVDMHTIKIARSLEAFLENSMV